LRVIHKQHFALVEYLANIGCESGFYRTLRDY
jgi:hypothetical protein